MTTKAAYEASPVDWHSDPSLRQVDVVVYTTAGTFVGHTYRTSRLRLLDVLNNGFAARGVHIGSDYIPMTEVEMYLPEGGQKTLSSIHIMKASVFFVAERSGGQPQGNAGKPGKVIVAKKPLDARLCLPPYILAGRLHSAAWAELVTSLHQPETFIPLTMIQISPALATGESQFDFVAVNKDQVVYAAEAAENASDEHSFGRPSAIPSRSATSIYPPLSIQPQMGAVTPPSSYARSDSPVNQPHRDEGNTAEKSLEELAEEVANKVRSLLSEKGDDSAAKASPDADIQEKAAPGGTEGDLDPAGKPLPGPEEELQAILDSSGDGIVLVDADHRIIRINRTIADASGYSQQEVRGRPLDALISPENLPRVSSLINKSLCGLPTEPLEVDAGGVSDDKPPLKVHVSTLKKDDQIVGAAITTVKAVEHGPKPDASRPVEDRSRVLIESSSDWAWEANLEYVYTYASPRVREILGYEPQEVEGKTIFDFVPPNEKDREAGMFTAAIAASQPPKLLQIVCRHKDGHRVTLETTAVPVLDGNGKVRGYQGISRDITQRETQERQFPQNMVKLDETMQSIQGIIEAMTLAIEARDRYAVGHQQRVAKLSHAIAREMGHSTEIGHAVRTAGLLHDVGKIFIPVEMLTKPGTLTQDEFATIKSHPGAGYEILKSIEFPWPIAEIVLQHHERMNGSGYPAGLKGAEIRLEARIVGVADTVEAMLHPRSYRSAFSIDKALREIEDDKGILFDRGAAEACLSVFLVRGFKFQSE